MEIKKNRDASHFSPINFPIENLSIGGRRKKGENCALEKMILGNENQESLRVCIE